MPYAVEHDAGRHDPAGPRVPDLIDPHARCRLCGPLARPAVDRAAHRRPALPRFRLREGVAPPGGSDVVVAPAPLAVRGVEIPHQPDLPPAPHAAAEALQRPPLGREGLISVLPPARMDADEPVRQPLHLRRQRTAPPPVSVFLRAADAGPVRAEDPPPQAHQGQALVIFPVAHLEGQAGPAAHDACLPQERRRPGCEAVRPQGDVLLRGHKARHQFPIRRRCIHALADLLQGNHIRHFRQDAAHKAPQPVPAARIRQAVGVEGHQLHGASLLPSRQSTSLMSDLRTSAPGP